jgi:hypothetical protein
VVLGDGKTSLFWSDRWIDNRNVEEIPPLLLGFLKPNMLKSRMVAQGLLQQLWISDLSAGLSVPAMVQFLALWNAVNGITLVHGQDDSIKWIWTASRTFLAKSAYLAFFEGCQLWSLFAPIWCYKAALKFKIFAWKAAWDRCWTVVHRKNHGLTNDGTCALCLQEAETIDHLLLGCSVSRSIWFQVLSGLARPDLTPDADASLVDWWIRVATDWPAKPARKICSILLLVFRSIWLERNCRIFKLKAHSIELILDSIFERPRGGKPWVFL